MISVSPLGSTLVVIRCSKLFTSWAIATGNDKVTAKTAMVKVHRRCESLLCIQAPRNGLKRNPSFKAIVPERGRQTGCDRRGVNRRASARGVVSGAMSYTCGCVCQDFRPAGVSFSEVLH